MARPVKCPRCGRDNDATFAFCLDCGQAMRPTGAGTAARHCVGCGAALQPGFKFCAHCGRPAAAGTPAPVAPPAAARRPPPASTSGTSLQVTVMESPPRLCAVRHDGLPGLVVELDREETLCGRTEGELRLSDDPTVSPRHARFIRRGKQVRVEDLGSVNGTYLRLRGSHRITVGEELRIGRQLVRVEPLPRPAPGSDQDGRAWGSVDPGATLRLAQLLEGGGVAEIFPLRPGENTVGRDAGDITFPGDRYVSARHAVIQVEPGGVTITDLGSSNGSFVKVVGGADLAPGDQLLLGAQLFRLDA